MSLLFMEEPRKTVKELAKVLNSFPDDYPLTLATCDGGTEVFLWVGDNLRIRLEQ